MKLFTLLFLILFNAMCFGAVTKKPLTYCSTLSALKTALATPAETIIALSGNITVTSDIEISPIKTIRFNQCKFVEGGGNIRFNGGLVADRQQIFYNFKPGQIKGHFNSSEIWPEWWGLTPKQNQLAINCAIKSRVDSASEGNVIKLAAGRYTISGPIDLSGSSSSIEGAGEGRTSVWAVGEWDANSYIDSIWGVNDHSAMVWIGSENPETNQSFRGCVKGITFNCYYAVLNNPTKRFSGISTKGWVEENSIIENVGVQYSSGYGIGFGPRGLGKAAVVNGVSIRNFWIAGPMKRDAFPIYFTNHAVVASIEHGTIDMSIRKPNSSSYALNDGNPIYPKPEYIFEYPLVGIRAAGAKLHISDVHLEGLGIGIHVAQQSGPSSITINAVDGYSFMDHNLAYIEDPKRTKVPAPSLVEQATLWEPAATPWMNSQYWKYSCLVLIAKDSDKWYMGSYNTTDNVHITNIRSRGGLKYLIRDSIYGVEHTTYGNSPNPNGDSAGVALYVRGVPYAPAIGAPPSATANIMYDKYNPANNTQKTYFIGPIW